MHSKQRLLEKFSLSDKVSRYAHWVLLLFLAAQPVLDISSYWLSTTGQPPIAGLVRIFTIVAVVLAGFTVSSKKLWFLTAFVVTVIIFTFRALFNASDGQPVSYADSLMFLRWAILPLLLLGYVSLIKANPRALGYTVSGVLVGVSIIIISLAIAAMNDTMTYAYERLSLGVIGWFNSANAHSMLLLTLSLLGPMYGILRKNNILFYASFILTFALLFMAGTRVAYFGAVIVGVIWLVALLTTKSKHIPHYVFISLLLVGMVALYNLSPMSQNRQTVEGWRSSLDRQTTQKSQTEPKKKDISNDKDAPSNEEESKTDTLKLYQRYVPHLLRSFGYEDTARVLNHSSEPSTLVDHRVTKDAFAQLIFESGDIQNRLFGYSYNKLNFEGTYYEHESWLKDYVFYFGSPVNL